MKESDIKQSEKEKRENKIIIITFLFMVAVSIIACIVAYGIKNDGKPTAEQLLSSVSMPNIPSQLDRQTVENFLNDELSLTLDVHSDIDYKYTSNQVTSEYHISSPVTGTLDVCKLSDGRSVVSIGGTLDLDLSSPYAEDVNEHLEKSYFLIANDGLYDADVFMRENNYTVSVNEAGEEQQVGDGGQWQFVNDRDINIDGLIEEWNKDHAVPVVSMNEAADTETLDQCFEEIKALLAKGAKVTSGEYKGQECWVLSNEIDFAKPKTKQTAIDLFTRLEASNGTFRHLNLSQFVEYFGDFAVVGFNLYFTDDGNGNYRLFVARIDLSKTRILEHFAYRLGIDASEMDKKMNFTINELYADLIILPAVPDTIKYGMEQIASYADEKVTEVQYSNVTENIHTPVGTVSDNTGE